MPTSAGSRPALGAGDALEDLRARCGSAGVELLEGGLVQRELAARMAERRRRLPARHRSDARSSPALRLGVRHAVPQLQRALQQRLRLAVRVDALGAVAAAPTTRARRAARRRRRSGGRRRRSGRRRPARRSAARARGPAPGAARRARRAAGRPRPPRAAARGGTVAAVVVGDQDVAVDRLAQRVAQRALVEAAGLARSRWSSACAAANERRISCAASGRPSTAASARRAACPARRRGRRGRRPAAPRSTAGCRPSASTAAPAGRPGGRAEDVGELVGQLRASAAQA